MDEDIKRFGRTLVIAPHPDDEVLGAGGTIARLAASGAEVFVAIVTSGQPPLFSSECVSLVRAEALRSHALLGVKETTWLDMPAARLSETPHSTVNAALGKLVHALSPRTLLIPFLGDIHRDHQLVFLSSMVAARPHQAKYPAIVAAYETVSETNWNAPYVSPSFLPNLFIDIENSLERKLEALKAFRTQLREAPHERSLHTVRALATLRGATIHRAAAEAFVMVRQVV